MYSVYILYSESSDRYYIGYTNNLNRRIAEHNRKKGKFTDTGIPWKLVHSEPYFSKKKAMAREKFIKSKKSKSFILELLNCR
jgi:putative endonuclease